MYVFMLSGLFSILNSSLQTGINQMLNGGCEYPDDHAMYNTKVYIYIYILYLSEKKFFSLYCVMSDDICKVQKLYNS